MAYRKSTQAEKTLRIAEVAEMLTTGHDRASILRHTAERWNLSERQTDTYLAEARQMLREQAEEDVADALARHKAIRRDLLRRALDNGSNRLALDVMRDEAKLLGLYSPEKLEIAGDLHVESATLESALEALTKRAQGL